MKPGALGSYTLRNAAWLTMANYSVRLAGFLFVLLAYKRFSATGYGEYVLAITYLNVLSTFSGLGLTNLINARVADAKANAKVLPAYNLVSGALLGLAGTALCLAKPSIPPVAVAAFCLNSILSQILCMRYFQEQLHKRWAVFSLVQSSLTYASLLIGLWSGAGVALLLAINFGSKAACCLVALAAWNRGRLSLPGTAGMPESLAAFLALVKGSGFWMILNSLANKVVSEAIPIFLGEGISLSILGTYDMVFKIVGFFDAPIYSMESVLSSRQSKAGILDVRHRHLPKIIGASLVLSLAAFAATLLVYRYFLHARLDAVFMAGAAAFAATIASLGYRTFSRTFLTILEKTDFLVMNSLVTTLFQVSCTILLVRSGDTGLHHVGLVYLAASLVSAAMYAVSCSLAVRNRPGLA